MKITCKNIWMTNCYLVEGENGAVVIDPGYKREAILDFLKENENKERLILLTHGHFDHIGGAEYLRSQTGVKIGIGALDEPALSDNELNCAVSFKRTLPPFSADYLYNDGDRISVGDIEFEVIACPGHTVGGISLLCEGNLFSGDTLFRESVGMINVNDIKLRDLEKSIKRLYTLPDDTAVLPGHGEPSTVGHEKNYNPFVRI